MRANIFNPKQIIGVNKHVHKVLRNTIVLKNLLYEITGLWFSDGKFAHKKLSCSFKFSAQFFFTILFLIACSTFCFVLHRRGHGFWFLFKSKTFYSVVEAPVAPKSNEVKINAPNWKTQLKATFKEKCCKVKWILFDCLRTADNYILT